MSSPALTQADSIRRLDGPGKRDAIRTLAAHLHDAAAAVDHPRNPVWIKLILRACRSLKKTSRKHRMTAVTSSSFCPRAIKVRAQALFGLLQGAIGPVPRLMYPRDAAVCRDEPAGDG